MGPKRARGTRLAHPEEEEALGILGAWWHSKKVYLIQLPLGEEWGGIYGEIRGSPQGLLWGSWLLGCRRGSKR